MKHKISLQEYHQKRYEITKDLLSSTLGTIDIHDGENKERSSLIFNCIQIAEATLEELFIVDPHGQANRNEEKSVQKLSDILKNVKE